MSHPDDPKSRPDGLTPNTPLADACDLIKLRAQIKKLEALVRDDAYAMTFQTMGQYRAALIKAIYG